MVVCQSDASHVSCQNNKRWSTEIPENPKILKTLCTKSYWGDLVWGKFPEGKMGFFEFQPRREVSGTWWNCTTLSTLIRTQGIKRPSKNKVLSAAGEIFKSIHQDSTYINRNFTNPYRWINVLAKIIDFKYIPVWTFLDTGIVPVYFPNEAFFQYIFQYPTPVQVFPVYSSIFQYRWPPCAKLQLVLVLLFSFVSSKSCKIYRNVPHW